MIQYLLEEALDLALDLHEATQTRAAEQAAASAAAIDKSRARAHRVTEGN